MHTIYNLKIYPYLVLVLMCIIGAFIGTRTMGLIEVRDVESIVIELDNSGFQAIESFGSYDYIITVVRERGNKYNRIVLKRIK